MCLIKITDVDYQFADYVLLMVYIFVTNTATSKSRVSVKGPFCDPQADHSLIPLFFSKKVEIFTSAEAFRYIIFVRKIFLAISFVGQNNRSNCPNVYITSSYNGQ